mmetsp:Transcript_28863/g.71984  ORF Transcript_28863/g.71984 Transcript_28863/m.71984 type:complete len:274 (-) Transcript_28863:26-847(-)
MVDGLAREAPLLGWPAACLASLGLRRLLLGCCGLLVVLLPLVLLLGLLPRIQHLLIFGGRLARLLDLGDLVLLSLLLAVDPGGGDEPLDLGCLVALAALDGPADDVRPHVLVLGQRKELADLVGALGTQAAGLVAVGEAGDVVVALLDHGEGEDTDVGSHDAAADGLALELPFAPGAEAGHALLEEQADSCVGEDALHHGEALLVVAAGDAEDVALELVTQTVARHLSSHALVEEGQELPVILDLHRLLLTIGGVRDVDLHRRPRRPLSKGKA